MFHYLTQEATNVIVASHLKAQKTRTESVLVAQLIESVFEHNTQLLEDVSINIDSFQQLAQELYKQRQDKPHRVGHTPPFSEATRSIILTAQKQAELTNTLATSTTLLNSSIYLLSQNPRLLEEPVYFFVVNAFQNIKSYSH
jgi:hypothetical protein